MSITKKKRVWQKDGTTEEGSFPLKKCPLKTVHCLVSDLFVEAPGPATPESEDLTPLRPTVVHQQRSGDHRVA